VGGSWIWKLVGLLVTIAAVSFVLGYFVVLRLVDG
jgi:hypothetical protein